MYPIFNRKGKVVGWLHEKNIYGPGGKHLAFIKKENVYNHRGEHKGFFLDNFLKDSEGKAVAFIEGATGGPLLPETKKAPIPPLLDKQPKSPEFRKSYKEPKSDFYDWGTKWRKFIE